MISERDRDVLDIVSNFDFTFCEVWYNGIDVNGTYLVDTLNRRGRMRKEYLPVFLDNNKFTVKRYIKYLGRGYTIDLGDTHPKPELPKKRIELKSFFALKILNLYVRKFVSDFSVRSNKKKKEMADIVLNFSKMLTSDVDELIINCHNHPNLNSVTRSIVYSIKDNLEDSIRYMGDWSYYSKEDFHTLLETAERIIKVLDGNGKDEIDVLMDDFQQLSVPSKKRSPSSRNEDDMETLPCKRMRNDMME
jgi:hypothetical protein